MLRRASTRSCSCEETWFAWFEEGWTCEGDSGGVAIWPEEAAGTAGAVIEVGWPEELPGGRVVSPEVVLAMFEIEGAVGVVCC